MLTPTKLSLVARVLLVLGALLMAGFGLVVFLALVEGLIEGALQPVDHIVLGLSRLLSRPWLDTLAIVLHNAFRMPFVLLLVLPPVVYLAMTHRPRMLLGFVLTIGAVLAVVCLTKLIFGRARPTQPAIPEIGYSFPSGHSAASVVICGMLAYIAWRYWVRDVTGRALVVIAAVAIAGLTGLSRVYLRVHYLSDTLAGWAIGIFILFGAILLLNWLVRE